MKDILVSNNSYEISRIMSYPEMTLESKIQYLMQEKNINLIMKTVFCIKV